MNLRVHLLGWVVLGVCLIAAVLFVAGGTASLRNAEAEQSASTLAAGVASNINRLSALELEARSQQYVSTEIEANVRNLRRQVEQSLTELAQIDGVDGSQNLHAYRAYLRVSEREFGLLAAGNIAAAATLVETRVDPRAAVLTGFVVQEQRERHLAAGRANAEATWRLLGSLVATGLLVALLAWQFILQQRGRRLDRVLLERLNELGRQKDEFVASVSHELRTPLTSIRGYTELLAGDDAISTESSQWVRVIERNANRLQALVNDLLLIAEVNAGKFVLQLDSVDLTAAVAEAVEAARPAAESKDIALTNHPDVQISLRGDGARLSQVLDNMLSNAIKFTPPGGSVAIRTSRHADAAVVEISDSGMGIAPTDQERLFERFYRTGEATQAAIQGTGLGLAISQTIVAAHEGTIGLTSAPGVGTTFRIELPIGATTTSLPVDDDLTLSLAV